MSGLAEDPKFLLLQNQLLIHALSNQRPEGLAGLEVERILVSGDSMRLVLEYPIRRTLTVATLKQAYLNSRMFHIGVDACKLLGITSDALGRKVKEYPHMIDMVNSGLPDMFADELIVLAEGLIVPISTDKWRIAMNPKFVISGGICFEVLVTVTG